RRCGKQSSRTIVPEQLDVMPTEESEESEVDERSQNLLDESIPLGLVESEWYRIYYGEQSETTDAAQETRPETPTCPYLKQQAAQKNQNRRAFGALQLEGREPLQMLKLLNRARHLYQQGEHYRLAGEFATAVTYYEKSHLVCPDCRYGQQAMVRIAEMEA